MSNMPPQSSAPAPQGQPVICPYAGANPKSSLLEKTQTAVNIGFLVISVIIAYKMFTLDYDAKKIDLFMAVPSIQTEYLVYTRDMGFEDTEFTNILSNQVRLPNSSVNATVCDTALLPDPLSDDELMKTDAFPIENQFVIYQSLTQKGAIPANDVRVRGYMVPNQQTDLKVGWSIHRDLFLGYGLPEIAQKYPDTTEFELGNMNPGEQILLPLAGAVVPPEHPDSAITIFVPTEITFINPVTQQKTTIVVPRANSVLKIDRCWETS